MLKNKMAKLSVLAFIAILVGSMFAGCSTKPVVTKDIQKISYNLGPDPQTIDPGLNDSVEGGTVIVNAFEGLVNINSKEQITPGVAKAWKISPDGLNYTFTLRKDAKWSDGRIVTAKDFEYAWKRALDPQMASSYAYQLFYLKNGQGYNESGLSDKDKTPGITPATKDQVGVQALDDYTLKVTLASPTSYFLGLTGSPTYMPIRKDVVDKDPKAWATKASTYICNGPFYMTNWKQKSTITFSKNQNYWNKSNIKLDTITYYMIDQETSATAAFAAGQVDINDNIPISMKPSLIKNGTAKNFPYLGTYYYNINVGNKDTTSGIAITKALKDIKVRESLNLAIDKQSLVKYITKGGEVAATSFVPNGINDDTGKSFKKTDYIPAVGDVSKAKKLLSDAGYPDGKGFPPIEILYNTTQNHQSIAAAIQDMLKRNLGINVTLRNVERKVQLSNSQTFQYQIVSNGWIADYTDPMSFLDMWQTGNGQNFSDYSNPAYDKLIIAAKLEMNNTKRTADMHKAEAILMNDLPIIPIYYYTNVVEVKSYIKDLHKSPLGFLYFQDTYIDKRIK